MAPYSAATDPLLPQPRKLRKPVIEKMRRDRINSSIEQLRLLLEKEIQRHQLPSKPEKADILEMTVTCLQRHMAQRDVQAQREGFSTCLQDSITFLSQHRQSQLQIQLLQNLPGAHTGALSPPVSPCIYQTPNKHSPPDSSQALWRPW
ncbi:transcription factor HES-5-like [Hyla sarda]|uniref:transcription factor HES-5-like n=1 Tax=Hyla sarda TaxID=327740 RepID=UPI0024C26538|nr:transcription factor HES-5-like [Hyla sarda]XP_056400427.1 transcription factor HES-5-like [Hyla sarda]